MLMKKDKANKSDWKNKVLRELALQFIEEGFGYSKWKQRVFERFSYNLTPNSYSNYMMIIVRDTFKYIEEFVAINSQEIIKPTHTDSIKIIHTPMINCRKWMRKDSLEIFYKFIRAKYKINGLSLYISVDEANMLYSQLMKLIKTLPQKQLKLKEKKGYCRCMHGPSQKCHIHQPKQNEIQEQLERIYQQLERQSQQQRCQQN